MPRPYYQDDLVTLYRGDCRDVTEWLAADVLVTDPPYGRGWKQGLTRRGRQGNDRHDGIAGDENTGTRDAALALWGSSRPALVFGDLMLPPPPGTKQVGVYRKPGDAGSKGAFGGFRRDIEAVYLIGPWPAGLHGRSSVIDTSALLRGGWQGAPGRYGHPHAKEVDVMEQLVEACPPGVIADPFSGSGSTLVAARNLGRAAIGVELEERHCETAARRLSQSALPMGVA